VGFGGKPVKRGVLVLVLEKRKGVILLLSIKKDTGGKPSLPKSFHSSHRFLELKKRRISWKKKRRQERKKRLRQKRLNRKTRDPKQKKKSHPS